MLLHMQFCLIGVIALLLTSLAAPARAQDAAGHLWKTLPIRSQGEFEKGMPGGESEQWMLDMTRSVSNPDRLYMAHDVGKVWRSDDNGRSWQHAVCNGLHVPCAQSVEVDPVNADVVFVIASSAWDIHKRDYDGLYRSEDAGLNWKLVLPIPGAREAAGVPHRRFIQRNITWDPTTVGDRAAARWYAAVNTGSLYRSDDAGRSWNAVRPLAEFGHIDALIHHPTQAAILYLCTEKGLHRSTDSGATFAPLGNLPDGRVRTIDINPADPSDIYATVEARGLFRSTDAGETFSSVRTFDAMRVKLHPTDRNRIYLTGGQRTHMLVSSDAGKTWSSPTVTNLPGREGSSWKQRLFGHYTVLLPDPRNPDSAVMQSSATLYRTDDGGRSFSDTSAGYTGYSWGWYINSTAFDRADPSRFVFFMKDVGMYVTENGGNWFTGRCVPHRWKVEGKIAHTCMNAGSMQPIAGSGVIVATAGIYWKEVLVRTEDFGKTWEVVDPAPTRNLFVSFHSSDPNIVYAHDKRSDDAGKTFRVLASLPETATIMGMAPSHPDTIYAMNESRTYLYRSDDRGDTWRLYTRPGWPMKRTDAIPSFAICPADENLVYSIDADGDMASFDGTTWRSLGASKVIPDRIGGYFRFLAIDPRHPEILYAAGFDAIVRSTDAGKTWENISGNLPRLTGVPQVHPLTGDLFWGSLAGTRILPPPYASENSLYHRMK